MSTKLFLVCLGIIFFGMVSSQFNKYKDATAAPASAQPPARPAGPSDMDVKLLAMENVPKATRDPDAAKLQNIRVVRREALVACGEVNAKNGFGAYSGFQRFIYAGKEAIFLEEMMAASAFEISWARFC
jgi:hypothetical protein